MRFDCFGGRCGVWGGDEAGARRQLESWHRRFSRFRPDSELSRLNRDPREVVPISADDGAVAGRDPRRGGRDRRPGRRHAGGRDRGRGLRDRPRHARAARRRARARPAPRPRPAAGGRPRFTLLRAGGEPGAALARPGTTRPRTRASCAARPGMQFDSGGLAKGLFADLLAERADGPFAVDCGGDLRFGGRRRTLEVADPFGGPGLHVFEIFEGAAATSGIGKRSWLDARRPACTPPAGPGDGQARVHGRRPGDGARAHGRRGRMAREGRAAQRRRVVAGPTAGWWCSTTATTTSRRNSAWMSRKFRRHSMSSRLRAAGTSS